MEYEGQYYADGTEVQDNQGSGLRRQLEAVLQQNQALLAERESFIAQKTHAEVSVALEKAGFLPGAAKFVPVEEAVDPARLDGWIKENAGLLARGSEHGESSADDGGISNIDESKADAIRKMSALSSGGANTVVDMDALHARMLDPNLSEKDFDNLVAQFRT